MISQSQNKSSKRWWVIFLFIPILISCTQIILWDVALYVGGAILYQETSYAIERVIDHLIENLFHPKEQSGHVIANQNNLLEGTYSETMEFQSSSYGHLRKYKIDRPRFVRESIDSEWVLAPDLKQLVEQVLRG